MFGRICTSEKEASFPGSYLCIILFDCPSFSNLAIIVTVPSVVTCALCLDSYDALFPFLRIIKLECEREKTVSLVAM